MANVANDANDLVRLAAYSRDQPFAEWFFTGKRCISKLLADYEHFGALPDLLLGEVPSAPQRDSYRAEVVLIHATKAGQNFIGRNDRKAFDYVRHAVRLSTEWQLGSQTDSFDAR